MDADDSDMVTNMLVSDIFDGKKFAAFHEWNIFESGLYNENFGSLFV